MSRAAAPPAFETRERQEDPVEDLRAKYFMTPTKQEKGGIIVDAKAVRAYTVDKIEKADKGGYYIRLAAPRRNKSGKLSEIVAGTAKIRSSDKGMREYDYTYIAYVPNYFFYYLIQDLLSGKEGLANKYYGADTFGGVSDRFREAIDAQGYNKGNKKKGFDAFVKSFNNDDPIMLRIAGTWSSFYLIGTLSAMGLGLFPFHQNEKVDEWILREMRDVWGYYDDGEIPTGAEWMKTNAPTNYKRYLDELHTSSVNSDILKTSEVSIADIIFMAKFLHKTQEDAATGVKQHVVVVATNEGTPLGSAGKVSIIPEMIFKQVEAILEKHAKDSSFIRLVGTERTEKNIGRVNITGLSSNTLPKSTLIKGEVKKGATRVGISNTKIALLEHKIFSPTSGKIVSVPASKIVVSVWKADKENPGEILRGNIADITKYLQIVVPDSKEYVLSNARREWSSLLAKATAQAKPGYGEPPSVSSDKFSSLLSGRQGAETV